MDKIEYLKKTLAHTAGKRFENYVITQIWAKVEDLGLYPVTQQYVKRDDGYALLDLYFPQIKFIIEVDELPHENEQNKDSDKKRMEEILFNIKKEEISMDKIYSSVDDKIIEYKRIKEGERIENKNHYYNYNNVKQQIDDVVKIIKEKVNKFGPFKWEENWQEIEYVRKLNEIKNRGKLLTSDLIEFKGIQIANDIFDIRHKNGKPFTEGYLQASRKSFFELSSNERIWFPRFIKNEDWEDTISDDWNIISEKYKKNDEEKKEINQKNHDKNIKRYTFAKYKNALGKTSYRFIGVFVFKNKEKNEPVFIYEKISDELYL
jgi:hypothetical protein